MPVKVTLAELPGMWLLAAMIPRGNMIQCMLRWDFACIYDDPVTGERKIFLAKLFDTRREGDSFHLEKLHMTEKESPIEIVEM